ncbi:hypothetical protein [Xenorhabdus bovienii]|uniref:hypothetical protein n=1 Tax=Xenorhabdus bovienii TaxID=40576 RepID=UPI0023B358A4|nr:hypothetical protein [Xenorhabdus bovienii]MDE9431786.1 hypothetical protein [Xenorhabdus bovienii]MDE9489512.1 hypothetical protein [Xenorhabdus bovienii]MDE9505797.1 hypothetical protein [Xenorhabdus bovienii]MDE9545926.1 hypothetical protein [Xenorhabdus bovienii]
MGNNTRASMNSAPDVPKKLFGFKQPFFMLGFSSSRPAIHVINNRSSQNQIGKCLNQR